MKFIHQLLTKRASKDNIPVKLIIENFLDKIQEYVNDYLERFQEAIQNEKSGSHDSNSTLKNLSMKIFHIPYLKYIPTPPIFLVAENKRSDYSSNKLFLHLRQIRRDLNILEIFYQETESLRCEDPL